MRTVLACLLLTIAAQAAHAGLIDRVHKGKAEEQIAKEFEASIATYLETLCKDKAGWRPIAYLEIKKQSTYCRLESIKGDVCTFGRMVKWQWLGPPVCAYNHMPFEPKYTIKTSEIPAKYVAYMYDSAFQPPEVVVGLACWLAGKKELWLANNELSIMVGKRADFKDDVENWLCEKFGWKRPEKGLVYVDTHELENFDEGLVAVTPEGDAVRLAELDKAAIAAAKKIEEQRGDTKGALGTRRKPPTERLETLANRIERFEKAFANTPYVLNKKNMEKLKEIAASIEADLAEIKTKAFAAERDGIDNNWADAAKKYDVIVTGDPENEKLVNLVAEAWWNVGVITNAGRECKNPDAMKKAAARYEKLAEDFPLQMVYHVRAGSAFRSTGDTAKARMHFDFVLKYASEVDSNRTYAANQLKAMKN